MLLYYNRGSATGPVAQIGVPPICVVAPTASSLGRSVPSLGVLRWPLTVAIARDGSSGRPFFIGERFAGLTGHPHPLKNDPHERGPQDPAARLSGSASSANGNLRPSRKTALGALAYKRSEPRSAVITIGECATRLGPAIPRAIRGIWQIVGCPHGADQPVAGIPGATWTFGRPVCPVASRGWLSQKLAALAPLAAERAEVGEVGAAAQSALRGPEQLGDVAGCKGLPATSCPGISGVIEADREPRVSRARVDEHPQVSPTRRVQLVNLAPSHIPRRRSPLRDGHLAPAPARLRQAPRRIVGQPSSLSLRFLRYLLYNYVGGAA